MSDSAGQGRDPDRAAIDSLPENATQPGGEPQKTEEPGRAHRQDEGAEDMPPAGPHAEPGLVNNEATPGAGTLTPEGEHDDVDSTSS